MFLADLLLALAIALLLSAIFSVGFGYRGPWGAWWIFMLVIFLAAWAGGAWITPFGPPVLGAYWLPMLFAGLLFALLLAAAVPPTPTYAAGTVAEARTETAAATALGVFCWVLMLGLLLAILVAYI